MWIDIAPEIDHASLGSMPSVLIIDDDDFSQSILCEVLQAMGLTEVQMAGSARAALRALAQREQLPDYLICDIYMPDMDGIEFLAKLAHQHYPGKLILVSGVDTNMLKVAKTIAVRNGLKVVASLVKPLNSMALEQALGPLPLICA
jgi:CheY-like chemotaxis protein